MNVDEVEKRLKFLERDGAIRQNRGESVQLLFKLVKAIENKNKATLWL